MQIEFTDTVVFDGAATRVSRDGYMVGRAKIARSGIQIYSGASVGRPEMDEVRVYRPEEEVFADSAMASLAHRPITVDHPEDFVTSRNWRDLAVGNTGGRVVRDGDYVALDLALMDQDAIDAMRSGKRELSVGYSCTLEFTAGKTKDGAEYDAIQRDIRGNHLALVDKARAGPECRFGDRQTQPARQEEKHMAGRTITVDGISFEVSDQAAQVVEKLMKQLSEQKTALDAVTKARDAKDGEIAALTKKHTDDLAAANAKLADAEKNLDARIEERQTVLAAASKVAGKALDAKGKTTAALRREAVACALGDEAVKDKSDDYVLASFDVLARGAASTTSAHSANDLGRAVQNDVQHRQPANAWDSAFASSGVAMKK
jgi:hypothetical protein